MDDRNLLDGDAIFDGFCHRNFDSERDGYLNTRIKDGEFPSLDMAVDIVAMGKEINRLREENWFMKKELKNWKSPRDLSVG